MGTTTIIIIFLTIELITTPPVSRKTCHIDILKTDNKSAAEEAHSKYIKEKLMI